MYSKQKPKSIQHLFDVIAPTYQSTNKVISFGLDHFWRESLIRSLPVKATKVLDLCTGTGDLIPKLAAKYPGSRITGLDFSRNMLNVARSHAGVPDDGGFIQGDVHQLPFKSNSFDLIVLSFSIRNFRDLPAFFSEVHRVLTPGGKFAFLELVKPRYKVLRPFYFFYLKKIMPAMATCISGQKEAYRYLAESIESFHEMDELYVMINASGMASPKASYLLGQGAAIISGEKPGTDPSFGLKG